MQKTKHLIYASVSGLMLTLSWPEIGWGPLIFFAWVPLLLLQDSMMNRPDRFNNLKLFGYSWFSFLVWNAGTTWWIMNASLAGALLAIVANSMIMAGVFSLFHVARKRIASRNSVFVLPAFWLAFEFLHFGWDLSWPWLTLGNAFASQYQIIQWYEFTGTSGGSLWILLINCLLFQTIKKIQFAETGFKPFKSMRIVVIWILFPILASLFIYYQNSSEPKNQTEIVIIQPNIDPYGQKFDERTFDAQLEHFLNLAEKKTDSTTEWIIGPETALAGSINEGDLPFDERIIRLKEFIEKYPKANILLGAETHKFYGVGEKHPLTARNLRGVPGVHYESFNSALLINRKGIITYHKSKLVPGVEQMPFPSIFRFVEKFAIDLGGTTGTLGTQQERTIMPGIKPAQIAAPAICYESVFGDFMREYVLKGANFIAVITNDGWWGDTPGYRQHLAYARLRAIENRREIVRSANTGISAIINKRGDIISYTGWWEPASIRGKINLNNQITLFTITGDLLGRSAVLMSAFIILYLLFIKFRHKKTISLTE